MPLTRHGRFKLHVRDTLTILNRPWRVSGIYETGMLARLVVPLDTLQKLTANTAKISVIYVKLDDPARTKEVIASLQQKLKEYQIRSMEEYASLFSVGSVPMLKEFIWVVIALGVLVGFLVVFLSMYTAVLERTREIGVLKALGASPQYILNILLRATALLSVADSLLCVLLAYVTRFTIRHFIKGSLIQDILYIWWLTPAGLAIWGWMVVANLAGLNTSAA